MKHLRVDLRPQSTPPLWAWALVFVLFLSTSVTVGLTVFKARQLEERRAQAAEERMKLLDKVPPPVEPAKAPEYEKSAREMLRLVEAKWPAMLAALESVEMQGVTPTAIEIDATQGWIRVEVEFNEYATLLRYVEALNAVEASARWSLLQARTGGTSVSGPQVLGKADIRAEW